MGGKGEEVWPETFILKTPTKVGESRDQDQILVPREGMQFETFLDAKKYYNTYAGQVGFGISTITSKKSNQVCVFAHLGCSKNGTSRRKKDSVRHNDSAKVGCMASIKVKLNTNSKKFSFYEILLEHNHELSKIAARYLRSHRQINTPEKAEIRNMRSVGIPCSKIVSSIAKRKGGIRRLQFTEKDCRNFLNKERRSKLMEGDAQRMILHFREMKQKDPTFYYEFDMNESDQLTNVFWIDGRSRTACSYFSDVITFDMTYLTNIYQMPFAPFVGVNHHGQSILLGCSLLCNETIESFVWLFKCWLEANGGVQPKAIITDQDKAIEAAVGEVFHNARHRFCLWHILKKIPEKIGHICIKYPNFMEEFDGCIYDSITVHEFEEKWDQLMVKYVECSDNDWLHGIYQCRVKWVPIFVKNHFFAGMSSTQRSESINHFFDGYVQARTTLEEFIFQYRVALEKRWDAETEADVKTMETIPFLQTSSPFEKHAAEIYTRGIFKKFQKEIIEVAACQPTMLHVDEKHLLMRVKSFERMKVKEVEKTFVKEFTVSCDKVEEVVECTCLCFQFRGYLCRHAIMALQFAGATNIPQKYLIKRWTKEMQFRHINDEYNVENNPIHDGSTYYSNLIYRCMKVAEVGSSSEAAYKMALEEIPKLIKKLIDESATRQVQQPLNQEFPCINDPPRISRKERPKEKRMQSPIEKIRKKCKRAKLSRGKNEAVGNESFDIEVGCMQPMEHNMPPLQQPMHPMPPLPPMFPIQSIRQLMQAMMHAMMQCTVSPRDFGMPPTL